MAGSGTDDGDVRAALAGIRAPQSDLVARTLRANVRRELLGKHDPPQRVQRFIIVAPVASGASGNVFRAYDPQLERAIALKLAVGGDAAREAQSMTEARALARLVHPNVVTVHDAGVDQGYVWIAMELVSGTTLLEHINGPLHPWRSIVKLFIAAGRGLAAAHEAGIVHRDFKPSNVLLSDDGRTCVADFGLAHALEAAPDEGGRRPGTPAYMAPEQSSGAEVDARADQFAFCVALFEALEGRRPFAAATPGERLAQIRSGPPPPTHAPRWLRRVVLRGLAADPGARFESMDDIVKRLENGLTRRRRHVIAGVAAASVVSTVGYSSLFLPTDDPCAAADDPPGDAWSAQRRAMIAEVAVRSHASPASQIWATTENALDDYATRWSAARRNACEATWVRHEQSERALDLRMQCLERARMDLDSLTRALAEGSTRSLLTARSGVAALPSLAACANTEALSRLPPIESSPAVEQLRADLSDGRAHLRVGDYAAARAMAAPAEAQARLLDIAPLLTEALLLAAEAAHRTGDPTTAEQKFRDALWVAETSRDEVAAATAAESLVLVVGGVQMRLERGLEWAEHARMANRRLGVRDGLTTRLAHALAGTYAFGERHEALQAIAQQQLQLAEEEGSALMQVTAYSNLAIAARGRDDLPAAIELGEAALNQGIAVWGVGHPNVAGLLNNLANAYADLGEYEASASRYERAIDIWRSPVVRGRAKLAAALMNLGLALKEIDRLPQAEASVNESIALYREHLGPQHPDVAMGLLAAGQVQMAMDDPHTARARYREALALLVATEARDGAAMPHALLGLGQAELALGSPASALEPLQDAWTRTSTASLSKRTQSAIAFELARALWDTGTDRDRARRLALRSIELAGDDSSIDATHTAQVRAWLAGAR